LEEEIWDTIGGIPNGKALSNDGVPVEFYNAFWHCIKEPFMTVEGDYATLVKWKANTHEGIISPIPKDGNKSLNVKDFRPITMLNVSNKIVTKTLAMRLRKVMGEIMHKNQYDFNPGKSILDNFLNMQEGIN